jgi:hypothetical protein
VRLDVLRLATAGLVLGGCGDGSGPDVRGGLYRLETVNGLPVPYTAPPSISSPFFVLYGGDLLLRRDGTFTLMLDGLLVRLDGTYEIAGADLTLTASSAEAGAPPIVAAIGGDSVQFAATVPAVDLVFRRSPIPSTPVRDAAYVLTAVNGRGAPFVTSDTVLNGTRYVSRVQFDSITFSDGVFFTEHRAESTVGYLPSGDSVSSETDGRPFGTYTGGGGRLVLRRYFTAGLGQPSTDSLAIANGTLTRVIRLRGRTIEEQYSVRR